MPIDVKLPIRTNIVQLQLSEVCRKSYKLIRWSLATFVLSCDWAYFVSSWFARSCIQDLLITLDHWKLNTILPLGVQEWLGNDIIPFCSSRRNPVEICNWEGGIQLSSCNQWSTIILFFCIYTFLKRFLVSLRPNHLNFKYLP